jgi:OPA family glycerol-3-phosphate transporter-like MFS transporter 1/2
MRELLKTMKFQIVIQSNFFLCLVGIIFGLWNSHTSMGNILGSLIAGEYVEGDWSLSFIVPGILIAVMGFVIFLFLVVRPADVACPLPDQVCD